MGIFDKKDLSEYRILERYGKSLKGCEIVGETETYRIYTINHPKTQKIYLLRQNKNNSRIIDFLGESSCYAVVFRNKVFSIDKFGDSAESNPLIYTDVETGKKSKIFLLSKKQSQFLIFDFTINRCQDVVESMLVARDAVLLRVTRYRAGHTEEKEFTYNIRIVPKELDFEAEYDYPLNVEESFWRDAAGEIECQEDFCPHICDNKCPIWLNTVGLTELYDERYDQAITAFKAALTLAPDFLEAHNNLGTVYGMTNRHKEAYEAFLVAYKIDPNYDKSLHGLIVAEKNLGMTKEALRHCDEYDKLPNCNSKHLRDAIRESIRSSQNQSYIDIAEEFLAIGRAKGYIASQETPYIPELLIQARNVCLSLINEIHKYGKENPGSNANLLSMAWCVFAGIGATYHWHTDWDSLADKGVFDTLTEQRGVFAMDEYVLDIIGVDRTGSEGEELMSHIMFMARCAAAKVISIEKPSLESIIEVAKALYLYGMVLEMNRLGMY